MDIYREFLLDHYQNPRNYGEVIDADVIIEAENLSCGDTLKLFLKRNGDIITEAGFTGEGCAIAIASASIMTEWLQGRTIKEAEDFKLDDLMQLLQVELTASRSKCAALSIDALEKALLIKKNN
ncbi:MAG: iron-sulfur cluster assembly scaffold protein [Candidatus Dojkabacteria bacterium]|uniref:NifU-like protein n=2 Tax=Candidatus Dojkabacteria TaxID=74243 RepID=A0A136KKU9_9BACT|nr:MAG: NifU-like protein [candidate division WS6 bacterium OLB21]MBW7953557.1 iron-sulfur cluster assembly scaffold protein [Candidatus Dojkabacteria bacterium]WKZ27832.1 MAG: iron-sulfur cluster assembly scaffold protein [Candidatus Dojkabacteria bacterium]